MGPGCMCDQDQQQALVAVELIISAALSPNPTQFASSFDPDFLTDGKWVSSVDCRAALRVSLSRLLTEHMLTRASRC